MRNNSSVSVPLVQLAGRPAPADLGPQFVKVAEAVILGGEQDATCGGGAVRPDALVRPLV